MYRTTLSLHKSKGLHNVQPFTFIIEIATTFYKREFLPLLILATCRVR